MRRVALLFLVFLAFVAGCSTCRKKGPPAVDAAPLTAGPPSDASALPGDAGGPPIDAATGPAPCKSMQEITRAAWTAVPKCPAEPVWETCVTTPTGSWGIEVGAIQDNGNQPTTACDFEWTLVHVDTTGTRATRTFPAQVRMGSVNVPRRMHAVDDDYLFLELGSEGAYGELAESSRLVLVARAGAILPHPGLAGRDVVDVADLDGDGRIDFILKSPFVVRRAQGQPTGMHGHDEEGPRPAAHVLADGSISFDDAVAQSLVRKQCPTPPSRQPPRHPDSGTDWFPDTSAWIACSRLWGASAETITAALDKRCASYVEVLALDTGSGLSPDDDEIPGARCATFFTAWAETKVPFLLK